MAHMTNQYRRSLTIAASAIVREALAASLKVLEAADGPIELLFDTALAMIVGYQNVENRSTEEVLAEARLALEQYRPGKPDTDKSPS
jgi:hypothetical protein